MSDQFYISTFGALEYNPDIGRDDDLAQYWSFLQNKATFKKVDGF